MGTLVRFELKKLYGKSYKGKEAISVRKEQIKEISGILTNERIMEEIYQYNFLIY